MKRTRIPRYTELRSSGSIAPKPRKASKTKRIYGSKARARWVKMLPCVGCGRVPTADVPNVNAHTETGGIGYKADAATIAPLCPDLAGRVGCHTKYDQHLPPFDTEASRDAIKRQAAVTDARWTRMGETRRAS